MTTRTRTSRARHARVGRPAAMRRSASARRGTRFSLGHAPKRSVRSTLTTSQLSRGRAMTSRLPFKGRSRTARLKDKLPSGRKSLLALGGLAAGALAARKARGHGHGHDDGPVEPTAYSTSPAMPHVPPVPPA